MGQPFLGEIKIMSFSFAPQPGWAMCNGQFLPINQNQALFSLLGTMYGGNGQTTFALPDLRGQVPIHIGGKFTLGQAVGEPFHTLTIAELSTHVHALSGTSTAASQPVPTGALLATTAATDPIYAGASSLVAMSATALGNTGGSQPHENRQPYLVLNFCIALQGIFPSRN
jgi:microcystin-dependent protein